LTVYSFILLIVDTHNKENPAKLTESVSNVSDSEVYDTISSSTYELDEINREQQKLVNKIDHKHTSDQTEKKIIVCIAHHLDFIFDVWLDYLILFAYLNQCRLLTRLTYSVISLIRYTLAIYLFFSLIRCMFMIYLINKFLLFTINFIKFIGAGRYCIVHLRV
jgi:hypothetical protein